MEAAETQSKSRGDGFLPRFIRGSKPPRRIEFWLLVFTSSLTLAFYVLANIGAKGKIPPHVFGLLTLILGLAMIVHLVNRWLVPLGNPGLLPIASFLNGIGYVVIVRWNPTRAQLQASWTAIGVIGYIITLLLVRRSRDLDRYRYFLLVIAVALLLAPLLPVLGHTVNGARLWIALGPIRFQPIEIAKLLLVVFFASYFSDKKEVLSIPSVRIGDRLVIDPRPLMPILLMWGLAMAIIGSENDIGFAMLLFTFFLAMLWLATGRRRYLVGGAVLFAAGAFVAAQLFHQVHVRVSIWLDPWSPQWVNSQGAQLVQGWYAMANGGVGGTGLGLGHAGQWVPEITSDMIFSAIGEELGLMGAACVVLAFALFIGSGFRIAQSARSDFARLTAAGLTTVVGFQAFFIMAGVLRILPLTGITLPFVAYGGSSLVANYILVAVLMRISNESAETNARKAYSSTSSSNASATSTGALTA
ncbi:MAG: FtsW/RodA/SpoVE family cell cycle protein [Actinomycetes bacterium]